MIELSETDVHSKFEEWKRKANHQITEKGLEQGDGNPTAHGFAAGRAKNTALYAVLLGDVGESRDWFRTAAEQHRACGVGWLSPDVELGALKGTVSELTDGLHAAVLSGDASLVRTVAETILDVEREQPYTMTDGTTTTVELDADRYFYAKGFAAVALGESDLAADYLDGLREANRDNDSDGTRHLRMAAGVAFIDGMLSESAERVTEGIERMLDRHVRKLPGEPEVGEDAICIEATSFLVFAKENGLEVEVDTEFIPFDYVEALVSDSDEG